MQNYVPCLLIIDDEAIVSQSLEALLSNEGYNLHFAFNGITGLQKAKELSPDVILLDLMMPEMDGLAVTRLIRSDPSLAEVPIIMITAWDDRSTKIECLDAGVDDFLSKPIDRIELRSKLRTITRLDRYRKLLLDREELEIIHQKLGISHQNLAQAYNETIGGWSRAMDLRDKETEGHSQRVMELTLQMASATGITSENLIHIRRGALLHDVGKLGIPDAILLKPAKLTDEEWVVMKMHPVYGFDMLFPIEYLRPALDIPHYHHEKWDGSGYPRSLAGDEIPLAARIFAFSDVYDALTSNRPYRPAWTKADALAFMQTQSGSHFDPTIAEIFFSIVRE